MTDVTTTPSGATIWGAIDAQYAAYVALTEQALPANKAALFDALAAAGVTRVVLVFDGSGDEGQIEDVQAYVGDTLTTLPSVDVMLATATLDGLTLDQNPSSITEAIEELAYRLLGGKHCGWQDNAGAYGEFCFDVADRTIQLDYNERIETSEYHTHSW